MSFTFFTILDDLWKSAHLVSGRTAVLHPDTVRSLVVAAVSAQIISLQALLVLMESLTP